MLVYCYLLLDVFNEVYFYKNPNKLEPTYFPLPDWRNTPTEGVGSSWVQRLCGRRKKNASPNSIRSSETYSTLCCTRETSQEGRALDL